MIHIEDDILYLRRLGLLDKLLLDRTTRRNIVWGSSAHAGLGKEYESGCEIRGELITGDRSGVIKTRARKELGARSDRTRKNGEVFTPLWICRRRNDYGDETWQETAAARGGKKLAARWRRYVDRRVLEITCGEAPYLASRYDAATGGEIPLAERIGIIDRKLRAVDENAETEGEWLKWAFRAFEAAYGYELLGDNLVIARVNLFMTFDENLRRRWGRAPTMRECQRLIKIITWNIWQADGLTGKVPRFEQWNGERRQRGLFDGIDGYTDETQSGEAPYCRVFDWRSRRSFEYGARRDEGGKAKMKFDFIIGNPPYQEEQEGDNKTFAPPVYHHFIESAYTLAETVELIHPARCLFNAGSTPKAWNEKMLNDPHLTVLMYEQNSARVFPNTDIKGGLVITYHDTRKNFGKIGTFTSFPELNSIMKKAAPSSENESLTSIIYIQTCFNLDALYREHPEAKAVIGSDGKDKRLETNVFSKMPFFTEKRVNDDDIAILGVVNNKRTWRYIPQKYIDTSHANLMRYKVILPKSNGSGAIGEVLSTPLIGEPLIGYTRTFISIGSYQTEAEAQNLLKYIKSRFCRVMLGILKVTQHNDPDKWKLIPLQDFTSSSDIDWSKSVAEIDRQLYAKYGLSDDEINFIETHVKEMA